MAYKIVWTADARKQRTEQLIYCLRVWGPKTAQRFRTSLNSHAALLSSSPGIGKREPLLLHRTRHLYRSLVVHKHFKLVYYIDEAANTLYIVALWDTRREPLRQADAT